MKVNDKIGVVILAAGSSSRLGFPKQLIEYKGGTLLQNCLNIAESLELGTKVLVLGAKAKEIERQIDPGNFWIVNNEDWEEGMGSSIRKGIAEALKSETNPEHILILLSDQPLVTGDKIQELIEMHIATGKPATFSEYAGDVGVPAIFSEALFADLQKLKGDQGAKKFIGSKNFKFGVLKFETANFDIDTAADVELLKQMEE